MFKKVNLIIFITISVFIFSGCMQVKTTSDLISRPKIDSVYDSIIKLYNDFLSDNEVLTIPQKQIDKEAIRLIDMDNDGVCEAILPFKSSIDGDGYGIKILKKSKGKWYQINKVTNFSKGFNSIINKDITNDKKPEMIISSIGQSEFDEILNIYTYHDGYFRNMYECKYKSMEIEDLDNDGLNELILLKYNSDGSFYTVQVLSFTDGKVKLIYEYTFDTDKSYANMVVGNVTQNEKCIFIVFDLGGYWGGIKILSINNNDLVEDLVKKENLNQICYGYNKAGFIDIDNDGIIEVGILKRLDKNKNNVNYEPIVLKYWYKWNDSGKFSLALKEYYNYKADYKIKIPMVWEDNFRIIEDNDDIKTVKFYSLDKNKRTNNLIFEIVTIDYEDWTKKKKSGYILLNENFKNATIAVLPEMDKESKYYIDENRLKEIFSEIEGE